MSDKKQYYELVYKDGMTHSSYNYELIKEIWNQDRDLISCLLYTSDAADE